MRTEAARVQQAADELGHRMNPAWQLSITRSKTVGVLVADLRHPLPVDVAERAGGRSKAKSSASPTAADEHPS